MSSLRVLASLRGPDAEKFEVHRRRMNVRSDLFRPSLMTYPL
jgi:hypothetical protein